MLNEALNGNKVNDYSPKDNMLQKVAKNNDNDMNNSEKIQELQSPFEQLKEVDADGKEWWNSRKLARVMGYGKYWNFERVMAKAQAWISQ